MNLSLNLYSLNENIISSSVNTLAETEILNGEGFKMGDCSFAEIKGTLKYRDRGDNTLYEYKYKCFPIKEKVVTPLTNSQLDIKTNLKLYPGREIHSSEIDKLNTVEYGYEVEGDEQWATLNNLALYPSINVNKPFINDFLYRVIRSTTAPNEGYVENALRNFYATDYYEMINNRGDGVAIRSNDSDLYIQMRFELFYTRVRDVLTTEDADAYLEVRDIFERPPQALSIKEGGYIGCEHKFSCKMTKQGYLTIDHKQGNIIIAKPEVSMLSSIGMFNYMLDNLEFEDAYREDVGNINKAIDNPFDYIGFAVGVDEANMRIFISKLYPPTEENFQGKDRNYYFDNLIKESNGKNRGLEVPVLVDNPKSWTFSYSFEASFWLCLHTFTPNIYWSFKKHIYALRNHPINNLDYNGYIHELNKGLKGTYFGHKFDSYIDVIFNAQEGESRILHTLLIDTEYDKDTNNKSLREKTIDALVVYNDTQCSGVVELDLNNKDVIRDAEGTYRVNNFRDIVINRFSPILEDGGDIDTTNLNFNKKWFNKSYFIGTFIVVRLIWLNNHQIDVYLNSINAVSNISKR